MTRVLSLHHGTKQAISSLVISCLVPHSLRGHYIGLYQFGKEAAQAKGLDLYCTASAAAFLMANEPWRYFISLGIFVVQVIQPGQVVQPAPGLEVTPTLVPHR